jgi:arsenite-transporting ATPase
LYAGIGLLLMRLHGDPTRVLFFTGKGGVGKTSVACATALNLADGGRRVLLVSTDPASNLDEVLEVRLSSSPTPVPGAERLFALNIDPEAAARAYRDRVVGPVRGVLPAGVIARMEEELSGACTTEIAAFDEFTRLLADRATTASFDHVIFDTAPTGHTLRLLNLPAAWEGFLATNTSGTSCLGPLAGLQEQRALYQASLATLADAGRTSVVLVARPDTPALTEAERTRGELAGLGITNLQLVINGTFVAQSAGDAIATALEARGRDALASMPSGLRALPRTDVPLRPRAPLGMPGLRALLEGENAGAFPERSSPAPAWPGGASLGELVDELARAGHGVILTMGKGGVGKTTIAAAIAAELARRGFPVHLTTTDPAAHVAAAMGDAIPGVCVTRIDAVHETAVYADEMLATASGLDARSRALLEEDLRSPCTEEVAVFRAFAHVVAGGEHGFVVVDTAPTGHTLLLLDAAQAYHRQVERTQGTLPESVRQLLPRLRDPAYARVVLVTLPEATPVHEAMALQDDLRRAGIAPFAWVVNQSFAATDTRDAVLVARGAGEQRYLDEVRQQYGGLVVVTPWVPIRPVGQAGLRAFIEASVLAAPDSLVSSS